MSTLTASQVLKALSSSQLIADELLQKLATSESSGTEDAGEHLLQSLIQRGELTTWQAEQILAGGTTFHLGKYRLLEKLGSGGMGTVFKARHLVMQRLVAIKVIRRSLFENSKSVERFQREIRVASTLDHPHIVRAVDADEVAGIHILVMDYIDGWDLDRWIRELGAFSIPWACELCRQAAEGLQHAFEAGLVHRDIKPANLIVTRDRPGATLHLKILDFGLARFAAEGAESGLTRTGDIMGTVDYISPEQAQNTRAADIRSDIFSLGIVLFYLLSRKLPYDAKSIPERLAQKVLRDAAPLRSALPGAPEELEQIVIKMLAREPRDRHSTPSEVAAALAPFCKESDRLEFKIPDGLPANESTSGSGLRDVATDDLVQWLDLHLSNPDLNTIGAQTQEGEPAISMKDNPERSARNRRVPVIASAAAILLILIFGFLIREALIPELGLPGAGTPAGDGDSPPPASSRQINQRLQMIVYRDGQALALLDALPVASGEGFSIEAEMPTTFEASLFWFDSEGKLHHCRELTQETTGDQKRLRYPHPGESAHHSGKTGTELLLICASEKAIPTLAELEQIFQDEAPWPAIDPRSAILLTSSGVEIVQGRAPGQTRAARDVKSRAESIRYRLGQKYEFLLGVGLSFGKANSPSDEGN